MVHQATEEKMGTLDPGWESLHLETVKIFNYKGVNTLLARIHLFPVYIRGI